MPQDHNNAAAWVHVLLHRLPTALDAAGWTGQVQAALEVPANEALLNIANVPGQANARVYDQDPVVAPLSPSCALDAVCGGRSWGGRSSTFLLPQCPNGPIHTGGGGVTQGRLSATQILYDTFAHNLFGVFKDLHRYTLGFAFAHLYHTTGFGE